MYYVEIELIIEFIIAGISFSKYKKFPLSEGRN